MKFPALLTGLLILCLSYDATKAAKGLPKRIIEFSSKFVPKVAKEQGSKNFLISPVYEYLMLSLLSYGADSETTSEIYEALDIPNSPENDLQKDSVNLVEKIWNYTAVGLIPINKIYLDLKSEVKEEFQKIAQDVFSVNITQLALKDSKESAKQINKALAEDSENLFEQVVADDLIVTSGIIAITAISLDGTWSSPFNKAHTKKMDFQTYDGPVEVEMMRKRGKFFYGEFPDLAVKYIEIPYNLKRIKFGIVLPDDEEGLSEFMTQKNIKKFHVALKDIEKEKEKEAEAEDKEKDKRESVDLYVPKFKVSTTILLKRILSDMGLKSIFARHFDDVTDSKTYVSRIVQTATIVIDEGKCKNTNKTIPDDPDRVKFLVNRSFYFFVKLNDYIIIQGRVLNPLEVPKQ